MKLHTIAWGKTVWRTPTMIDMLAAAKAGAFDLLLAGYSDRWQRNLRRTLELLEDELHPAGVAVVLCDRRILSSDPHDWDELVAEAAAAERYSRRLSERITEGFEEKFKARPIRVDNPPSAFGGLPSRPTSCRSTPTRSAPPSACSSVTPWGQSVRSSLPMRPASLRRASAAS